MWAITGYRCFERICQVQNGGGCNLGRHIVITLTYSEPAENVTDRINQIFVILFENNRFIVLHYIKDNITKLLRLQWK